MKVLVIAAHPDDEILGCGGTIIKHLKKKHKVVSVILGEGITSRDIKRDKNSKKKLSRLKKDATKANLKLGIKKLFFENLPDNRFDDLNFLDVVKIIEKYIDKYKPNIIYTHSSFDLNKDHKITSNAVMTASRPQRDLKFLKKILFFETPSSSEWENSQKETFKANYHVDISRYINTKISALKEYKTEMKRWPHPRSLRGIKILANLRGAQIGCEYAEAFYLARQIDFE